MAETVNLPLSDEMLQRAQATADRTGAYIGRRIEYHIFTLLGEALADELAAIFSPTVQIDYVSGRERS